MNTAKKSVYCFLYAIIEKKSSGNEWEGWRGGVEKRLMCSTFSTRADKWLHLPNILLNVLGKMVRYSQLSPMVIPLGPLCYIYPISILFPPGRDLALLSQSFKGSPPSSSSTPWWVALLTRRHLSRALQVRFTCALVPRRLGANKKLSGSKLFKSERTVDSIMLSKVRGQFIGFHLAETSPLLNLFPMAGEIYRTRIGWNVFSNHDAEWTPLLRSCASLHNLPESGLRYFFSHSAFKPFHCRVWFRLYLFPIMEKSVYTSFFFKVEWK